MTSETYNLIRFPKLNLQFDVDSVAFEIGGYEIAWYGVIITFGMILAMIFGFSKMKKFGVDPDKGIDCVIAGIFGGIIGARLYYVVMEIDSYKSFKDIIDIREGGLAIYGGVIGALLFGCITAKFRKVKILPLLDVTGMSFLIGQSIGRWGNFCNHEAFGSVTDLPWGMTSERIINWIENNTDIVLQSSEATVHPCFLYESIWCLIGFLVIYFGFSKRRKFDGQIFLLYIFWYGLGRSFIEGLRLDSLMIGTMRVSQILAIVSSVAALLILLVTLQKVKQLGTDYVMYIDSDEFKAEMEDAAKKLENQKKKDKSDNAEDNVEDSEDTTDTNEDEATETTEEENGSENDVVSDNNENTTEE